MSFTKQAKMARLCFLLVAIALSIPAAQAQTEFPDSGHWVTCESNWMAEDHSSGPNFTVRVSFRGQPIAGTRVVLMGEMADVPHAGSEFVATHHTDSNGVAHFSGIPRGTYKAHIERALLAPGEEIDVEAGHAASNEFQIEWPEEPIVTRSVRGWIRSWQKSSPQNRSELRPHGNVLVQLLDLRSGHPLASMHTNSDGYYEFYAPNDGLYVLRIGEHPDPSINSYDQAVEVAGNAMLDHVPDLEVDRVCGRGMVRIEDESDREKSPILLTQK
jgi:hypothetical protein